ncbi:MAG: hypothetical protein S4CHLAM7_08920 [Chlamydiae bacterium]|nr:hypothetical protein [Chlamydiota bacterium]
MKAKEENCAGVIPLRKSKSNIWEILLALHTKGSYWAFPKGHIEENESPYSAAERELLEELNLEIDSLYGHTPIKENYEFERNGELIHKFVTYYPAFVKGTIVINEPHEVVEAKWFSINDALMKITFDTTRKALEPLIQTLKT